MTHTATIIPFESVQKLHGPRRFCPPSLTSFATLLLEATARWPQEAPKKEPICINQAHAFRKCSPPPQPREFWMDLDPAC